MGGHPQQPSKSVGKAEAASADTKAVVKGWARECARTLLEDRHADGSADTRDSGTENCRNLRSGDSVFVSQIGANSLLTLWTSALVDLLI